MVVVLSIIITLRLTQASRQELMSLNVQYIPPGKTAEGPSFLLSSNDHDRDLSDINFVKISFIQLDDGKLIPAGGWILIRSGHHFQGKLYFQPLTTTESKQVRLIIKANQNDKEMVYEWPRSHQ